MYVQHIINIYIYIYSHYPFDFKVHKVGLKMMMIESEEEFLLNFT